MSLTVSKGVPDSSIPIGEIRISCTDCADDYDIGEVVAAIRKKLTLYGNEDTTELISSAVRTGGVDALMLGAVLSFTVLTHLQEHPGHHVVYSRTTKKEGLWPM